MRGGGVVPHVNVVDERESETDNDPLQERDETTTGGLKTERDWGRSGTLVPSSFWVDPVVVQTQT